DQRLGGDLLDDVAVFYLKESERFLRGFGIGVALQRRCVGACGHAGGFEMVGYFFGFEGTVVNRHFVDFAFEVGEVVAAAADEELWLVFGIGDVNVADRLGLGVTVEIHRDAAAVAGDDQVVPGAKGNVGVAREDFVALVAVEENQLAFGSGGAADADVIA